MRGRRSFLKLTAFVGSESTFEQRKSSSSPVLASNTLQPLLATSGPRRVRPTATARARQAKRPTKRVIVVLGLRASFALENEHRVGRRFTRVDVDLEASHRLLDARVEPREEPGPLQ